ncbi:hypothetical protein AB0I61_17475 [Polymorphospora rubra]|uniref:hypothetical protein n=1 Tax=Polymorphospora rubra TaxID=338584 RepID=UPI0033C11198
MSSCQSGRNCNQTGTHELVVGKTGTGVLMCGPHARDAVNEQARQGETSVWMRRKV